MRPAGYGEDQPRLDDDRLPIVLIILDGLGDRHLRELGDRTPSEAARTPHLDRAAAIGMNGWHVPFGWGRAPTSELAHWAMFGFSEIAFPGRAVLEALGAGIDVPTGVGTLHAALRTSTVDGDQLWITGRAERGTDDADAELLFEQLGIVLARHEMSLATLGGRGEALLRVHSTTFAGVTDSDPFFETFHPWLRPLPTAEGASRDPSGSQTAERLTRMLLEARAVLLASPTNARRAQQGRPPLDVLTTKWAGGRGATPSFLQHHGIPGAAVTSTRLYRGIATILGMDFVHVDTVRDTAADMTGRLERADDILARGAQFVHVHTKATDEAGHTKNPYAKRDVLQAIDEGLGGLEELATRAVVAVTGDHATPSSHGVVHTADPSPLVVLGPTVRQDPVGAFGETAAAAGWLGRVDAVSLLPLLAGFANRPALMGHRVWPGHTAFLPDAPAPMPLSGPQPFLTTDAPST